MIVIQTDRGRALLDDALDIVEDLEASFAAHLGEERLAYLKESLNELVERIDPIGPLGTDCTD